MENQKREFTPFKVRIQSWSEAKILQQIDLRILKERQALLAKNVTKAARLRRECNTLSQRLCELRTAELFPSSKTAGESSTPPSQDASEGTPDPTKSELQPRA